MIQLFAQKKFSYSAVHKFPQSNRCHTQVIAAQSDKNGSVTLSLSESPFCILASSTGIDIAFQL